MNSNFEILKGLPPYGKMYVPIPDGDWSEGLPVEFTKDDGTKWVANIAKGQESFNYVNELKNTTEILVISYGDCYIIDRNKEKSICDFGYDFNQVIELNDKFILIGTKNIAIVESSEKIERFKDLCWDFIEDIKIENGILSGVLNDYNASDKYDKTDFNIDLETYELTKPKKKFIPKIKAELKKAELKKWWEIWK
ncbi:hypothetical protein M601_005785 [Cellulophaga baltica 4]|nr:hypothetical protein M601_005785 [Cellulophaga baltica 4]